MAMDPCDKILELYKGGDHLGAFDVSLQLFEVHLKGVVDLRTTEEEIEKLIEESQINKDRMLKYKSTAQVNESALKEIEVAHENFKVEADRVKKSLEAELSLLRQRVNKLESDCSLETKEVASAITGQEEALAAALSEISSLKEELSVKMSYIVVLETQISALKDDLEKEHQRWHSAQANYEEQGVVDLRTAKEEFEKLSEEAQFNKDQMLQYKSNSQVNEAALKQIEIAHGNFKVEADRVNKPLEAELSLLRERVNELESDCSLKAKETSSAIAGQEEALVASLSEISSLKDELSVKTSQVVVLEEQISAPKDDLEKEQQTWRSAQGVVDLRTAEEEIEKLRKEAQVNKDQILLYKSNLLMNESALKEIEIAHENFKVEAGRVKKSLEAELSLLRERDNELESNCSLKTKEAASAIAGQEEALAASLSEISSLKDELSVKTSHIVGLETKIAALEDDLDKVHKKWCNTQANYQRQGKNEKLLGTIKELRCMMMQNVPRWTRNAPIKIPELSLTPNFKMNNSEGHFKDEFTVIEVIGAGTYGKVFKCKNILDEREYAVKRVFLHAGNNLQRASREVKVLARLQHPNIVRFFHAWVEYDSSCIEDLSPEEALAFEGAMFIKMELCARPLRDVQVDEESCWRLFDDIVNAVAFIHSKGVIHCDLSSANIFLDDHNNIRIGDFGLAKNIEEYTLSSILVTPNLGQMLNRAPEICGNTRHVKINCKVDIYSVGVVLIELLHSSLDQIKKFNVVYDVVHNGKFPSTMKSRTVQLVQKLLAFNPVTRPFASEVPVLVSHLGKPVLGTMEQQNPEIEEG